MVTVLLLGGLTGFNISAQTLSVGVQGLPDSLDTAVSSFAALNLALQTMDPLILRDDSGALEPGLAVSWQTPDPLTWIFKLRPGVKFHDGQPFTAEDVKFTFDYILAPTSVYGSKGRISQIASTRVVDPLTVEIKTKAPFATLLNGMSDIPIEPKHYVEKVGRAGMVKTPMGTGPFKFARWVPADRYELTANPAYWHGAPKVERLILRQIPEASTRVASLIAGETQIIEEVPIDLVPQVEQSKGISAVSVESTVGLILTFDTRKPPFDDVRVRQALNLAVNKQLILDRMLRGKGALLQGQMLTSNTFGFNPKLKAIGFDPTKAKALLADAGQGKGFATSITTRSGKYLSDVDISNAVAGMFLDVGVKAAVNVVEQGVFSKMATANDMGPIHMVGWYSLGDADFATVWFTEKSGRAFWKNDEYERLFLAARSTVDKAAREKAYNRMMEIMQAEVPAIFLFGLPSVYGVSGRLKNFAPPSDKVMRLHKTEIAAK
ncbi:MAG: ABC transporter substrate-binding protein [Burkholderiaceae bacterium]